MKISLGFCGPTDCCLRLHKGDEVKQYAIESLAWKLLGLYWNANDNQNNIPKRLGEWIWKNRNGDIIE